MKKMKKNNLSKIIVGSMLLMGINLFGDESTITPESSLEDFKNQTYICSCGNDHSVFFAEKTDRTGESCKISALYVYTPFICFKADILLNSTPTTGITLDEAKTLINDATTQMSTCTN